MMSMDSRGTLQPVTKGGSSFVTRVDDRGVVYLRLPREILRGIGVDAVQVHEGLEPEIAAQLLSSLATESSAGHTWRRIVGGGNLSSTEMLSAVELELRSARRTTVFTYIGEGAGGERVPIGFAAISDRVCVGFPYDGYPVLARAFIDSRFRGLGLYRHIVSHRVEVCERRWGADLMAIHMGASTPRVASLKHTTVGYMGPFVPIGHELLELGGDPVRVVDLLAVSPRFMDELTASLADNQEFFDGIVGWLKGSVNAWNWGRLVSEVRALVHEQGERAVPSRLVEIMALASAIGVVED